MKLRGVVADAKLARNLLVPSPSAIIRKTWVSRGVSGSARAGITCGVRGGDATGCAASGTLKMTSACAGVSSVSP